MRFCLGNLRRSPDVNPPGERRLPGSRDWRGIRYEWHPARRMKCFALDVERLDTPPPDLLLPNALGPHGFLAAWTRAEALAKLLQVPILTWLKSHALAEPTLDRSVPFTGPASPADCWTYTGRWPEQGLVFTCAWVESA